MSCWRSAFEGFDVDAFCDPSGRGKQAPAFCSIMDEPFIHSFIDLKVFAFPSLHLVFNWGADVLVAVLSMMVAHEAGLASCLLHSYGSFQGNFTRTQANHTRPCPAMGFVMGVYDLSARC